MQNSDELKLEAPSLPKGGGAITGLNGNMAAAGPDGSATLTLPLPVSRGRGYAPSLILGYHSRAGNGPFGIGWSIDLLAIRRRTNKGMPAWDRSDEFTGPDGEVLLPVLTNEGATETRTANSLLDTELGEFFTVRAYRTRIETDFSRLEHWVPQLGGGGLDFWVLYSPDGQVHLLGRNDQARISNVDKKEEVAVWLIESSVSATGEQIYWQYREEDDINCAAADDDEVKNHPNASAQRYLVAAWYGNRCAARTLPGLLILPEKKDWLFALVLDYGERTTELLSPPEWIEPGSEKWLCRKDRFSNREYGFELRTRRLCRQFLMYHAISALNGDTGSGEELSLISRQLLDYNESESVTTLKSVQQVAYEKDNTPLTLPPLEFGWQDFQVPDTDAVGWEQRDDMGSLNPQQPYQIVDLNGEGIAGILYQDRGAWLYRAAVRGIADDAVTWDRPQPLPVLPALQSGGLLADLNGDGYLEWVVTAPGVAGHYDRTPERGWRHFTPFSAFPLEYGHFSAQLTDVTGSGKTDLVLIGPKSVRLYSGTADGWKPAKTVVQLEGVNLPRPDVDASVLVAFSDIAGCGQQYLVEVSAKGVRYWPNLGHGSFGKPVSMKGFVPPAGTFNPDQLYLADIDGSGTTDLIYAQSKQLVVYRNQSGNSFAPPFSVNLPNGVHFDRTCGLQLADIQGLGVASLVLTVPHSIPCHWVCHLTKSKPWLLNSMNNNMGARHGLHYRSSVQFWLDEKAEAKSEGKSEVPACYLPFALHTLQRTEIIDEITGNHLTSVVRYRHGAWDSREREFRGFGFVEVSDTDAQTYQSTETVISMPAVSRSWYATGLVAVDDGFQGEYWKGDAKAFKGYQPRFTCDSGDNERSLNPQEQEPNVFWLNRGLKGLLLRSELYGQDSSAQATIPYTVTENRLQVRLVDDRGVYPVVLPVEVESRTYVYERVSSDPQCSQQVLLSSDEYGQPLRRVSISYPRRSQPGASPYLNALPKTLFADSYDEQQQELRFGLSQNSWLRLNTLPEGIWMMGLPDASRSDAFISTLAVPGEGITIDTLLGDESPIVDLSDSDFGGQQKIKYLMAATKVAVFPPLVAYTETAVLDENTVNLSGYIKAEHLKKAGYIKSAHLFPRDDEKGAMLWVVRQGYTRYDSADNFRLPVAYQETMLTGQTTIKRDPLNCVVKEITDASGLTSVADYDWRFLRPYQLLDVNGNTQSITLDALGRVTTVRFKGTENGIDTGYSDTSFELPKTVDKAINLEPKDKLPVHQCLVYAVDSWSSMQDSGEKLPPHVVTLTTDSYDVPSTQQQIRQQVAFSDGFGRALQVSTRQVDGDAWQRTDGGQLVSELVHTDFRWAVSGRTEYDNKGRPIRMYQPYFLDSWKYIGNDDARQDLYADTHSYDPIGRENKVITAKGYLRRSIFTPWFVVSEDENDTLPITTSPE